MKAFVVNHGHGSSSGSYRGNFNGFNQFGGQQLSSGTLSMSPYGKPLLGSNSSNPHFRSQGHNQNLVSNQFHSNPQVPSNFDQQCFPSQRFPIFHARQRRT
jgi:hypothetical protein